jgi:hypothetical protein
MLRFVVVAALPHGWVPRCGRVCARSQPKFPREGVSPPVLYGRRRLLLMLYALATVVAPAHVSD